jgi:Zn-dependent protease
MAGSAMQVSCPRIFSFVLVGAIALSGLPARTQDAAEKQVGGGVVITISPTTGEERLVLDAFESFARAALAGQFAQARGFFDVDVINRAHVTAEGIRDRYRQFETKYGRLKSIKAQGIHFSTTSGIRIAEVAVVHEYESKPVQFLYGFRQRGNGWTVLGFKEGNFAPGAVSRQAAQGRQRQLSLGVLAFFAFFLVLVPIVVLVAAGVHLYRRHMVDELQRIDDGSTSQDLAISPDSQFESTGAQTASARRGLIQLFRFGGINVFLHWSWFVVAAVQITTRKSSYSSLGWNVLEYLALFVIVMLHEFGHALACRQVGGTANQIVLWPLGGVAFVNPPPRPGATLWSIAAGPLVNVILVSAFFFSLIFSRSLGLPQVMPNAYALLRAVTFINLLLLAFNLLPIYPLDGGQILRSLLWFAVGRARSLMVATIIGFVGAAGLIVLALWKQSPWFGIVAVFMVMNCWTGLRHALILSRLPNLPRHEGYSCPSCKAPPPVGDFWRCSQCGTRFDAFRTQAACPHCATQIPMMMCMDCSRQYPMSHWIAPEVAGAPTAVVQSVSEFCRHEFLREEEGAASFRADECPKCHTHQIVRYADGCHCRHCDHVWHLPTGSQAPPAATTS